MPRHGYRLIWLNEAGAQWVTIHSIEKATEEAQRLGWPPEEVELYALEGREDEPTLLRWRSGSGETFSEVLATKIEGSRHADTA